jgi:hypothetical protein
MHRLERVILGTGTLLAFLVGTNYCLFAALVGPAHGLVMACHADPSPSTFGSHGCCDKADPVRNNAPKSANAMPCCMVATAISAPELAKPQPTGVAAPFAILVAVSRIESLAARWHGLPARLRDRPPASPARAPLGSRAPPLA